MGSFRRCDAPDVSVITKPAPTGMTKRTAAAAWRGLPATETPRHLPEQVFQQDTRLVIR
jgi:hypothetical protein